LGRERLGEVIPLGFKKGLFQLIGLFLGKGLGLNLTKPGRATFSKRLVKRKGAKIPRNWIGKKAQNGVSPI